MTWDPYLGWRRFMAAGLSMLDTNRRTFAMFGTAGQVIAMRSAIVGKTMASPMTGDYAELQRFVPEKVDAFTRAAVAGTTAWWDAQQTWIAHMQHLGGLTTRGRPPAPHELITAGTRTMDFAVDTAEVMARLGSTTLDPVHRTVTANAKRLKRRPRPASKSR